MCTLEVRTLPYQLQIKVPIPMNKQKNINQLLEEKARPIKYNYPDFIAYGKAIPLEDVKQIFKDWLTQKHQEILESEKHVIRTTNGIFIELLEDLEDR